MADKLLNRAEVRRRIGIGNTTLWRWEKDGHFPKRLQVGEGRVAWRESDIDAWIESLPLADREGAEGAV